MTTSAWNQLSSVAAPSSAGLESTLPSRIWMVVGVTMVIVATMNAWQYSSAAAGPLVQADSWYFLDTFLSKYFDGSLRLSDLFIQREPGDHSQPLQKLILLFHTRYFDMDFRVEGLIGISMGIAWCAVLAGAIWKAGAIHELRHAASPAVIALIFLLGLSLNSSNIFTWSLVTLAYLPVLIATLFFLAAQHWGESARPSLLLPATFLLGISTDEIAIIVVAATFLSFGILSPASRRNKVVALISSMVGLGLARAFLWYVSLRGWNGAATPSHSLFDALSAPDAIPGMLAPFSDSLIHFEHVLRMFPNSTNTALAAITLFVLLLHLYFWITVLLAVRSNEYERSLPIAVFLMLFSYALTAGIVTGRVPVFGWGYLHQPRYVLYYQIGLVAIAIMLNFRLARSAKQRTPARTTWRRWPEPMVIAAIACALVLVQLAVSNANWNLPRYLTPYLQNAAFSMKKLADDPANPPQCPDIMSVCDYTLDKREKLMNLLVSKQLNIFSPGFQMRNRLYPSLESIPGFETQEMARIAPYETPLQKIAPPPPQD